MFSQPTTPSLLNSHSLNRSLNASQLTDPANSRYLGYTPTAPQLPPSQHRMRQNRQTFNSSDPGQLAYNRRSSPLFYPQQQDRGRPNSGESSSNNYDTTDFDHGSDRLPGTGFMAYANLRNLQDSRQQRQEANQNSQESSSNSQFVRQMVSERRDMIRKRKAENLSNIVNGMPNYDQLLANVDENGRVSVPAELFLQQSKAISEMRECLGVISENILETSQRKRTPRLRRLAVRQRTLKPWNSSFSELYPLQLDEQRCGKITDLFPFDFDRSRKELEQMVLYYQDSLWETPKIYSISLKEEIRNYLKPLFGQIDDPALIARHCAQFCWDINHFVHYCLTTYLEEAKAKGRFADREEIPDDQKDFFKELMLYCGGYLIQEFPPATSNRTARNNRLAWVNIGREAVNQRGRQAKGGSRIVRLLPPQPHFVPIFCRTYFEPIDDQYQNGAGAQNGNPNVIELEKEGDPQSRENKSVTGSPDLTGAGDPEQANRVDGSNENSAQVHTVPSMNGMVQAGVCSQQQQLLQLNAQQIEEEGENSDGTEDQSESGKRSTRHAAEKSRQQIQDLVRAGSVTRR